MDIPKFTPGPWEILDDDRTVVAGDAFISDVGDTSEGLEGDCPAADANARLIAAAPDLYDACRAVLDRYDQLRERWGDEGFTRSLADRVRAAVKLADEGRQPC